MRRRWRIPALLLAALLAQVGGAAAPETPAPATKVAIVSLGDVRGSGAFSRLEIEVELPEFLAADVAAARVRTKRALDDTGRDLLPEEKKGRLEPTDGPAPQAEDGKPAPAVVKMTLKNPARRAGKLADVSGEIELYLPGRDPDAVARIAEVAGRAGGRLESPALAAAGVTIAMLTREQLAAEKKRLAEQRKEDARKHGVLGEVLEPIASAFLDAFLAPDPGDVVLRVEDPGERIVGMRLLDASGADRTTGRTQQQGFVLLSSGPSGPGAGWILEVGLTTPESVERRSFRLRDVPLP